MVRRLFSLASVSLLVSCSPSQDGTGTPNAGGTSASAGTGSGQAGASAGTATTGGAGGAPPTTGGNASGGAGTAGNAGSPTGGSTTAGSTTGGSATGGGGAGSMCGAGSVFCTDFEASAVPDRLAFYPDYMRAMQKSVSLDTTVVHGGKQALKVSGTDFSQMLGVAVPSKFWGRVYLRSDTDIQEGHNTYLAAGTGSDDPKKLGDPNDGTYIRIGEHECQVELNRNTDDKELLSNGGMPYACEGGVKLLKDTWYCVEFYYDGPGKEVRVFVDNAEVTALHVTDWGPYDYKIFKLGFEKYHGAAKTLWYDDLALANEQVHCL